jgi:peptidoglycan/LPS O-acetylase OafA/YrhL
MKRFFAPPEGADPLVRGGALDALRFLAAAFIVLYHYEAHAPLVFAELHPALGRSYLATDFFLMLSGYVLGRTYGPRLAAGRVGYASFLTRRISRVWPAHVIVLAGFAVLVLAAGLAGLTLNNPQAFQWSALPAHAVLAQSWGLGVPYGWNTPAWSLSALILCYAAFPMLWAGLSRVCGPLAVVAALAALVVADLVAPLFGQRFFDLAGEYGVLRALPLFAFGAALARYGAVGGLTLAGARVAALTAAVAFVALQLLTDLDLPTVLAIAAVTFMCGARADRRPSRLVARAAELSFALYITHSLTGLVWYRVLDLAGLGGEGALGWAIWLTGFPVALTAAWAFHHVVDMPLQGWINERLKRRAEPRPAVVGA